MQINSSKNPVYLVAKDIEMSFGETTILDKANLSIHKGERIGLIGRNGAGKTTFLKILAEFIKPDGGNIEKKRDITIGFLSQNFTLDEEGTVFENLLNGARDVLKLIEEFESEPHDSERRHELEAEIVKHNGWNIEHEINALITSMELPAPTTLITNFSGGEKRRVALAKALVSKPDILIFDEPTNHLDTERIEWLENFLQKYQGACIFVTHDRYFLDKVSTRIIELSHGALYSYPGNYTQFLEKKLERIAADEHQEKNRQRFLKRELEWLRRGPQGRTTKAKGRLNRYHELAAKDAPARELDVEMLIPPAGRLSDRVLDLKNVGYKVGDRWLFRNVSLQFEAGMRLGIIGKNGLGKSTLVKVMLGQLPPTEGSVDIASRTEINYADQEKLEISDESTVLEAVSDGLETIKFGDRFIPTRSYLKRFLFTEKRLRSFVKNLSGGERSRLLLAKILKNGGNFIVLDEPTNDLDLSTLRVLEEALVDFEGCSVVVSHDRYFLNRVCTHILAFEGNGKVRVLGGDYDFYKKYSDQEGILLDQSNTIQAESEPKPKLNLAKLKELKKIERQIVEAEQEVTRREIAFSAPDFYEKYGDKITEMSLGLQQAKDRVNELYKKWESLENESL